VSQRIEIEAGGDVEVSADRVGGDKIVGEKKEEERKKPSISLSIKAASVGKILAKTLATIRAAMGL
jgi:hypothetical protein